MLFLLSVSALLFTVLITVATNIRYYNEHPNQDNFLYLLPEELYMQEVQILAVIINLGTTSFFILPVL